jgi:predicted dehydrogenase
VKQNLLLIGAGALGSRHLQSLAAGEDVASVTVVEPRQSGRDKAKACWAEIEGHPDKVLTFQTIDTLSSSYDGCIISTPSVGRLKVLERVIGLGVGTILCEKVLFQTVADLRTAAQLVDRANADVRVNHIYRYSDAMIELRERLAGSAVAIEVVVGGDGMGCNLIHYVDLLEYLACEPVVSMNVSIDRPLRPSKRGADFVEFCGEARGATVSGSSLHAVFREGPSPGPQIKISSATSTTVIDEQQGSIETDIPQFIATSFGAPRVSSLSFRILNDQRLRRCLLPTLGQSLAANRLMLTCFNRELCGEHHDELICPIT